MRAIKIVTGLALSCFLAISPVTAAQYLITYKGTITSGFDTTGEFGAPNTDLAGKAYTAQYLLDTGTGAALSQSSVVRTLDGLNSLSPLKGSLTIGGVIHLFGYHALTHGTVSQTDAFDGVTPGLYDEVNHYLQDFDNGNYYDFLNNNVSSFDNNIVNTTDYTASLYYVVQPLDRSNSGFLIFDGPGTTHYASGSFAPATVQIQGVVTAVPEPATWIMLIGGFGAIGISMRRRRPGKTEVA